MLYYKGYSDGCVCVCVCSSLCVHTFIAQPLKVAKVLLLTNPKGEIWLSADYVHPDIHLHQCKRSGCVFKVHTLSCWYTTAHTLKSLHYTCAHLKYSWMPQWMHGQWSWLISNRMHVWNSCTIHRLKIHLRLQPLPMTPFPIICIGQKPELQHALKSDLLAAELVNVQQCG